MRKTVLARRVAARQGSARRGRSLKPTVRGLNQPSGGDRGFRRRIVLIDDHDCHRHAETVSLIMFRKWFQIAGTDTAHGNTTIRTYSANYERHYHAVLAALPDNSADEIR